MISGKYHLKTHFFLFSLSVKISDYHPFLKNGCLIENKMHGASTQLGPVSHKCKLVGARVFPGRHVYGVTKYIYIRVGPNFHLTNHGALFPCFPLSDV